jgi:hypothetical protein
MREKYAQMVADSTPGRFEGEGPMTAYVHELSLDGCEDDFAGDFTIMGCASRFGKRILWASTQGFISLERFNTVAAAEAVMEELHTSWDDTGEE